MKYLIGFFFGVLVAAAAAQGVDMKTELSGAYFLAGVDPNNISKKIMVDQEGYVICSDHHKGEIK